MRCNETGTGPEQAAQQEAPEEDRIVELAEGARERGQQSGHLRVRGSCLCRIIAWPCAGRLPAPICVHCRVRACAGPKWRADRIVVRSQSRQSAESRWTSAGRTRRPAWWHIRHGVGQSKTDRGRPCRRGRLQPLIGLDDTGTLARLKTLRELIDPAVISGTAARWSALPETHDIRQHPWSRALCRGGATAPCRTTMATVRPSPGSFASKSASTSVTRSPIAWTSMATA